MQLVVCGVRQPVQVEKSGQHLGRTRWHQPPRSKSLSGTRSAARGSCDNLDYALKLLASQYQCDVSPARVLVKGLQERSRLKMMEGLRKFIMMDNHEAIRTGDLENAQESYVP